MTYIATTPEKVFGALTKGEVTRQYWGYENVSDWKPGSPWKHQATDGSGTVRMVGEVVECKPPRRLVLTWAFPADAANKAKHTRVTFEIERIADMVRLTVTHDELESGSEMDRGIREGWPRVLSSLKTSSRPGSHSIRGRGKHRSRNGERRRRPEEVLRRRRERDVDGTRKHLSGELVFKGLFIPTTPGNTSLATMNIKAEPRVVVLCGATTRFVVIVDDAARRCQVSASQATDSRNEPNVHNTPLPTAP